MIDIQIIIWPHFRNLFIIPHTRLYNGYMRIFRYDKLVRDNIVPNTENEGSVVVWRILDDDEYAVELAKKLEEDLDELEDGVGQDRERDLRELADVAEIYETAWEVLDRDEHYELFEAAMTELEKGIDMWEIDPDELLEAKAANLALPFLCPILQC